YRTLPLPPGECVPGDGHRHTFHHASEIRLVDVDFHVDVVQAADGSHQIARVQVGSGLEIEFVDGARDRRLHLAHADAGLGELCGGFGFVQTRFGPAVI